MLLLLRPLLSIQKVHACPKPRDNINVKSLGPALHHLYREQSTLDCMHWQPSIPALVACYLKVHIMQAGSYMHDVPTPVPMAGLWLLLDDSQI